MRRDRLALFLAVGVPLIAYALLALTFSHAVIRGLGVGVVDDDRSPTSIAYVQLIASSPGVTITTRFDDLSGAAWDERDWMRHPSREALFSLALGAVRRVAIS